MVHSTKLCAMMLGISACAIALTNNAVALDGEDYRRDGAPDPNEPDSKFAGPKTVPDSSGDDAGRKTKKVPFRPFAITVNVLSTIIFRPSVNFEGLPAAHHAIIVNPSYWLMSWQVGEYKSYTRPGIELGYRLYSGEKGADGLFIGSSFIYNYIKAEARWKTDYSGIDDDGSAHLYGFAVDMGGQHIFAKGWTIGGGFGIAYYKKKGNLFEMPPGAYAGVSGRALFMIGYSF